MGLGQNMLQESFSRTANKDEHNTYYTFIGYNYDIFSQFSFSSWLGKINNFHLNRKVKQQNPTPPPKRPRDVSPDKIDKWVFLKNQIIENINGNMLEEIKNCWIGESWEHIIWYIQTSCQGAVINCDREGGGSLVAGVWNFFQANLLGSETIDKHLVGVSNWFSVERTCMIMSRFSA